jgi:hypothetical protein
MAMIADAIAALTATANESAASKRPKVMRNPTILDTASVTAIPQSKKTPAIVSKVAMTPTG